MTVPKTNDRTKSEWQVRGRTWKRVGPFKIEKKSRGYLGRGIYIFGTHALPGTSAHLSFAFGTAIRFWYGHFAFLIWPFLFFWLDPKGKLYMQVRPRDL